MLFGYFTLLVALIIETVGAYYSITGLAAIFSGAVVPILIMGASLEIGKVTAAVWLKLNWERASLAYKLYLVPAVAFLMLLTSMGIFGFLSKAHSDQSLISGDSMAKVAIYDEKIKAAKDNIDANRRALKQMDEAVDQVMARSDDEKGADKAVSIRRSQQKERARLLAEIETEQRKVSQLSEERAPIAAEFRKVESEVGPIKYIAALIYGDNPDANILERAVRWVIILIVAVFDPLALVLILAAQQSLRWERQDQEEKAIDAFVEQAAQDVLKDVPPLEETPPAEKSIWEQHPYLLKPFDHFKNLKPMVATPEKTDHTIMEDTKLAVIQEPKDLPEMEANARPISDLVELHKDINSSDVTDTILDENKEIQEEKAIESEVGTQQPEILAAGIDVVDRPGDYVTEPEPEWTGPMKEIIEEHIDPNTRIKTFNHYWVPDLDAVADNDIGKPANAGFGTSFPESPEKSDMYVRVDYLPPRLFKFNGAKWIEVDKNVTDSFYDEEYIKFLIDKINKGEYTVEDLSEIEQEQIRDYLNKL